MAQALFYSLPPPLAYPLNDFQTHDRFTDVRLRKNVSPATRTVARISLKRETRVTCVVCNGVRRPGPDRRAPAGRSALEREIANANIFESETCLVRRVRNESDHGVIETSGGASKKIYEPTNARATGTRKRSERTRRSGRRRFVFGARPPSPSNRPLIRRRRECG